MIFRTLFKILEVIKKFSKNLCKHKKLEVIKKCLFLKFNFKNKFLKILFLYYIKTIKNFFIGAKIFLRIKNHSFEWSKMIF